MEKALLSALLTPHDTLRAMQDNAEFGRLMFEKEKQKMMPLCDVWEEYLARQGLSEDWYGEIEDYEREVLVKRV